jgi:hypothetical protein
MSYSILSDVDREAAALNKISAAQAKAKASALKEGGYEGSSFLQ